MNFDIKLKKILLNIVLVNTYNIYNTIQYNNLSTII